MRNFLEAAVIMVGLSGIGATIITGAAWVVSVLF